MARRQSGQGSKLCETLGHRKYALAVPSGGEAELSPSGTIFSYDANKARSNREKHAVAFGEAETILGGLRVR